MSFPLRACVALLGLLPLLPASALAEAKPAAPTPAAEIPEPYRSLPARLRERLADFPLHPAPTDAAATEVRSVTLNRSPVLFDSGHAFDAIRFRAPDQPGLDLVWAFSTPAEWRHWYILPVAGDASKRGFKNWINGDRAYAGLDGSTENPVTLQTLDAAYFEPGREYLLWFCQTRHTPAPAELKLVLRFAARPEGEIEWNREAIETALGLKAAAVAAQADYFSSRGARVLLDRELFHADDAQNQMDHFLSTRRSTEFMHGGFFVTMETITPPCHGAPRLADIIARHGPPDVTDPAAQQISKSPSSTTDPLYDRHHFDYFVFETDPSDATGRVRRVSSQYFNTASARPAPVDAAGPTWTQATLRGEEFRFFFQDGREVARYASWDKPSARLVSGSAPAGEFVRRYPTGEPMEKLIHDGAGLWTYESRYLSGPVYRRCTYREGRLEGELTDWFEDGRKRATLTYRDGLPEGRFTEWTETGEIRQTREFADGREVAPASR